MHCVSDNFTLELEHLGRFSESPLTLNCPTTGLPPTNTYWNKGSEFLRNGRTYGITTVIRNRKTSTFNNFLRIKQTLQQAEGLYFFGAVNAMNGRVQNLERGPNLTSGMLCRSMCKCTMKSITYPYLVVLSATLLKVNAIVHVKCSYSVVY